MESFPWIGKEFIEKNTVYDELVHRLSLAFSRRDVLVPPRIQHQFSNISSVQETSLLLMPAWQRGQNAGVKIITVNPDNAPAIQGCYVYLDANKGSVKALIEATSLTSARTAASSALASQFLSRRESKVLLMIGTGHMSSRLIRAHARVRSIEQVFVWGRSPDKAEAVCEMLQDESFSIKAVRDLDSFVRKADIISSATLSASPLIHGRNLRKGQHIDLVGSFRNNMREADDEVMRKAKIFVDVLPEALHSSGDIAIPLSKKIIRAEDIRADLYGLCSGELTGRNRKDEITVFKSVGHALEDLCAANYYYSKFKESK